MHPAHPNQAIPQVGSITQAGPHLLNTPAHATGPGIINGPSPTYRNYSEQTHSYSPNVKSDISHVSAQNHPQPQKPSLQPSSTADHRLRTTSQDNAGNANPQFAYTRYSYLNPPTSTGHPSLQPVSQVPQVPQVQPVLFQPTPVPTVNFASRPTGQNQQHHEQQHQHQHQLPPHIPPNIPPQTPQTAVSGPRNIALETVIAPPRIRSRDRSSFSSASQYSNDSKFTNTQANAPVIQVTAPLNTQGITKATPPANPQETINIMSQTEQVRSGATSPAPATKLKQLSSRKRSSTACDKCRQKKIKCDNGKPRCGACTRNGFTDCHYSSESHQADIWLSDAAYNGLSSKLDSIMNALQCRSDSESGFRSSRSQKRRKTHTARSAHIQHWDVSFTSIFKWQYFQKSLDIKPTEISRHIGRILTSCEVPNIDMSRFGSVQEQLNACTAIEDIFHHDASSHLNAFLINSHTKVPFLDIVKLIESIEIFTLIRKADDSVTLPRLLSEFHSLKGTQSVGPIYLKALSKLKVEDTKVLQKAYRVLCSSAPVLLLVCAIGAISAPVSLDNIGTYENSLEERSSVGTQKKKEYGASPYNRFAVSQMYMNYTSMILAMFPCSLKPYSIASVKYHVLLSQYHQYTLNPSLAHEEIITACNYLVFYIERFRSRADLVDSDHLDPFHEDALINRLYWTCLKLECELRIEFSPHVPLSNITKITPPSSFFTIPDPFQESEHTSDSISIANKYDDQNTWYYFLTEIAVRKVDNNMLDEVYPAGQDSFSWDNADFASEKVWKLTIKYSNQLNGIVDSLTPAIRNFVLSETDPAQIYTSIKRKAVRRKKSLGDEERVLHVLDDFLVNEDLLHHAQSESVMYIKTRILSSKMLLMRPFAYMYLHDQISFDEIIEAAMEVLAQKKLSKPEQDILSYSDESGFGYGATSVETGSEGSIYQSAAALNVLDQDDESSEFNMPRSVPAQGSRRKSRFEDFSDLVDYAESDEAYQNSEAFINTEVVRKRILVWFVAGILAIPKLNIPKMGSFRHPGSWYYIRNLILGIIMEFLLYKKTQDYIAQMTRELAKNNPKSPSQETMETMSSLFQKDRIQSSLEHALLIADYWKDERKDCEIYGEYLRQCLARL
ncbi:hypothetical protein JCM33374_g5965 [Metschnikowia sp. JCM 33374]|nr:hypothetical protein JCM33374_g5965 [Metschnikowia sp. JCM 33374]